MENALIVLCGNKSDLTREVTSTEAAKVAEKEGLLFFEVSAKTNDNIINMFYYAIAELPFFEQYEIDNKQKLVEELANENRGEVENSMLDIIKGGDTPNPGKLEVKGAKSGQSERGGCKC